MSRPVQTGEVSRADKVLGAMRALNGPAHTGVIAAKAGLEVRHAHQVLSQLTRDGVVEGRRPRPPSRQARWRLKQAAPLVRSAVPTGDLA